MRVQYSREELLEISTLPVCRSKPDGLHTPPGKNQRSEYGSYNKSRRIWPISPCAQRQAYVHHLQPGIEMNKFYPVRSYCTSPPHQLIRNDYDPYVLGPQRQSFGTGCSINSNRNFETHSKYNTKGVSRFPSDTHSQKQEGKLIYFSRNIKKSPSKVIQKKLVFPEKQCETNNKTSRTVSLSENSANISKVDKIKNISSVVSSREKKNIPAIQTTNREGVTDESAKKVVDAEKKNTTYKANNNPIKSHSAIDVTQNLTNEFKNSRKVHSTESSPKKHFGKKDEKISSNVECFSIETPSQITSLSVNGNNNKPTLKCPVSDSKKKNESEKIVDEVQLFYDSLNINVQNNNNTSAEISNIRRVQFCDTVKEIDPNQNSVITTKDIKSELQDEPIMQRESTDFKGTVTEQSAALASSSLPISSCKKELENRTLSKHDASNLLSQLPYDLRIMVINAKPSAEMLERMEAKAMIDGLRTGKMTVGNIMCQLQNSALQPRHRDLLACILKMHLEKGIPPPLPEDEKLEKEKQTSLVSNVFNTTNSPCRPQPTWDLAVFQEHLARKKKNKTYNKPMSGELPWPPQQNRWSYPISYTSMMQSYSKSGNMPSNLYTHPGQPTPPRVLPQRMVPIDMAQVLRQQLWFPQQTLSLNESDTQKNMAEL